MTHETIIDELPALGVVAWRDPEKKQGPTPEETGVALRLSIVERVKECNAQKGRLIEAANLLVGVPLRVDPYLDPARLENDLLYIEQKAWYSFVQATGILSAMSIKDREAMESQLHADHRGHYAIKDPLPPFKEEILFGFVDKMCADAPAMIERAIKEIFDWLRPYTSHKTNDAFMIGNKVVRSWVCERGWNGNGSFRIRYGTEKNIDAMGNVFSMLDGKGIEKHPNVLSARINTAWKISSIYDDTYMHVKAFQNGNAHITFKRPDLVAKINETAGKLWLRDKAKEDSRGFSH